MDTDQAQPEEGKSIGILDTLRPIVHVGFPKTATTSIQKHLFLNLDPAKVNVHVTYNDSPWIEAIRRTAIDLYENPHRDSPSVRLDEAAGQLFEIQKTDPRRLLFSHEGLCGRPWDAFRSRPLFFEFLKKSFKDPIILVVLREPFAWLESLYRFSLQTNALSPDRFLCWDRETFETEFSRGRKAAIDMSTLSLLGVIDDLFSFFGKENVIVLNYTDVIGDIHRFSRDFASFIGVDLLDSSTLSVIEKKSAGYYRSRIYYQFRNRLVEQGVLGETRESLKDRGIVAGLRLAAGAASRLPGNRRNLLETYRSRIQEQLGAEFESIMRHRRPITSLPPLDPLRE